MPINDQDRPKIVQAIRAYIARERISREEFAQRAKLGKSTVDKLVIGMFSEKTILQIESALQINLRGTANEVELADPEVGKYTREDVRRYLGEYVFARPSFRDESLIYAYQMEVVWDPSGKALLVKEKSPNKKALQFGKIYIPRASMHMFILSNESGWLKSVILSQLDVYKRMKGLMLTMGRAFANVYAPMAMPVIMNKYDRIEQHMIGTIAKGTEAYDEYLQDLSAVEKDQFAKWVQVKSD